MKHLFYLVFGIIFITVYSSCNNETIVYSSEIQTYTISKKELHTYPRGGTICTIWFQTPESTEHCNVSSETYNKLNVNDTIKVLVKYHYKTK